MVIITENRVIHKDYIEIMKSLEDYIEKYKKNECIVCGKKMRISIDGTYCKKCLNKLAKKFRKENKKRENK